MKWEIFQPEKNASNIIILELDESKLSRNMSYSSFILDYNNFFIDI